MQQNYPAISGINDASRARMLLWQAPHAVHAPVVGVIAAGLERATGELDLAVHGLKLDGRDETSKFEDAFAAALDRGWSRIVMPGGRSLLLTEAVIPAGTFDVNFRGSTILADFDGALAGGTANAIRALSGSATTDLTLRNLVLDGQRNPAVTLTDEARILDVEGYRNFKLLDSRVTECGRGGTPVDLILDRDDRAINIHDCYNVLIDGLLMDANAKFEVLVVQSSDKRTQYHLKRLRCVDHVSTGTPISVFNCGPGKLEQFYIDGLSGSGINGLSEDMEICFGTIKNVTDSNAIDLYEGGLFYSHRSHVHHCHVENIGSVSDGVGIRACGNGLRVEQNTTKDCLIGISVENNIGATYPTYGTWLQESATEISGVQIHGNTHDGHNAQSSGLNANIRVLGESATKISFDMTINDSTYPTVKTEYGVILGQIRHGIIRGKAMHGQDGLIRISEDCDTIVLDGLTTEPEVGQGVNHLVTVAANVTKIIANRWTPVGALDGGFNHIARVSSGTLSEIQLNDSPSIATISVPANTRILRDGKIYHAPTPFQIIGSLTGGARLTGTLAVSGVRSATDEVINCTSVSNNAVQPQAWVSADNQITIAYRNTSESTITDPSINLRILIGPKGYSV